MYRMRSMCDDLRYGSDKADTEKRGRVPYASGQHCRADDVNGPKARINLGFIFDRSYCKFLQSISLAYGFHVYCYVPQLWVPFKIL